MQTSHWPHSSIGTVLLWALLASEAGICATTTRTTHTVQGAENPEQKLYANVRPYMELPPGQLVKRIPELKAMQPVSDQQLLGMILEKTGQKVDGFFHDIVNVVADEDITLAKVDEQKSVLASQELQYNYMILLHREEKPARFEEYREDLGRKPTTPAGGGNGYSVNTGFTMKCIYFKTARQKDSTFRYLGEQMLNERNTYVVAFAQNPGQATISESMIGSWGTVSVLVQGIVWVDKETFQIIRVRTDLLAPPTEIGLDRQTTEVTFKEFHLPDTDAPAWLPSEVNVDAVLQGRLFRNEHRYTNYRLFRVSTTMR